MLSDGDPRFNHPNVHAIHRNIRRVMDDYPEAVTIGEVWVFDNASWAEYLRADELHLGFNFRMVRAEFDITEIRHSIENTLAAAAIENATPTWTLENHDVVRAPSRYGGGAVGLDRARAMALVTLALPGAVFLYNGQELGLANVELPDEALRDPTWERSGHTVRGRDGCRIPIPWRGDTPPFGFSASADTWLPMPPEWAALTVEKQLADADSTLSFFQHALEIRRSRAEFAGEGIDWLDIAPDALAFARHGGGLRCVLNTGNRPLPLPAAKSCWPAHRRLTGSCRPTPQRGWPRHPAGSAWRRRSLYITMTYAWTVIGAGPAGIAAVGKLLDRGIAGKDIAWIDPAFAAGDIGAKWRSVSSNTQVGVFLELSERRQRLSVLRSTPDATDRNRPRGNLRPRPGRRPTAGGSPSTCASRWTLSKPRRLASSWRTGSGGSRQSSRT